MKKYKSTIPLISLKKEKTDFLKVKIRESQDSYDLIRKFYSDDIGIYESFFLLLLNRANNTIGYVKISQGGTAGTVIDNKLIPKYAIDSLSNSVILAHNHPSGNLKPSDLDIRLTRNVKDMLEYFDVNVLDHIILSESNYFSFADESLL